MMEKLKAPFWFGLPMYAWVAGGVALVAAAGYFFFFAKSTGLQSAQDAMGADPSQPDNNPLPYPDPGAGGYPPPAPALHGSTVPAAYSYGAASFEPSAHASPTQVLVNSGVTHATSGAVAYNTRTAVSGAGGHSGPGRYTPPISLSPSFTAALNRAFNNAPSGVGSSSSGGGRIQHL